MPRSYAIATSWSALFDARAGAALGAVSPFSVAAVKEISSHVVSETAPKDIVDQIEKQDVSIIRA